ncbi:MAG: serine/threonine protein kinase [Deltaproteobacteria bacterium]|nr:serine/threonine protein kinase [Deltaproteobacteria bacterium]
MEYLEGETLADLLTEREILGPSEAIDILLPVLGALSAAHDEGIVHRDIKPANIFLVTDKKKQVTAKVLDFGIAKLVERAGEALTVDDSFIGTPEYMAPEQGRGERDLDPRADQFSVAAILYHAITGRKLYVAGNLIGLVRLVSEGEFEAPRAIRDDIPEGLEKVMLRALDRDRDRRFASVVSFGKALLPYASEATQRLWQDRLAHASDPAPAPRPRLQTRGETPNALAREQEEPAKHEGQSDTSGPVDIVSPAAKQSDPAAISPTPSNIAARPSADDTRRVKVIGEARPAAAAQQPPMWMWLALLATLAVLGFAAVSLGF